MNKIKFIDDNGTFELDCPENISGLYFPLASETGLKSAITPDLGGDCKLDQESFLLEPAGIEDLHERRATRNFWCITRDGAWSASGVSAEQEAQRFTDKQDRSKLTAGFMWQTVQRESENFNLSSEITSFIPPKENVEIMRVKITNTGKNTKSINCIGAIPIYGRSADNLRDHRNVTSMLHRIRTSKYGVRVKPTMSFDEKGHRQNSRIYYVMGITGNGEPPESFYPTVESFIGEGGTFLRPRTVCEKIPGIGAPAAIDGREAMGGIAFAPATLSAGESAEYIIFLGITEDENDLERIISEYGTRDKCNKAFAEVKEYWQNKVNVRYHTGSSDFDRLLRWVSFQPILRRLFGCSFLPHHDYGRGGRGWRDLWQDCLSLLLMDPNGVGDMIRANFGGVRIDGTNATIIGEGTGNFIADRNGITRVWMDHGLWPLITTKLYIDQTGDIDILFARVPYFKDARIMRGNSYDGDWDANSGSIQRTQRGDIYLGSILEHLLIQNLTAFYEVGEHNICRLRGADWNDALDMAQENGESVAFTCAYAGNLRDLAELTRALMRHGYKSADLIEELEELLKTNADIFRNPDAKNKALNRYSERCKHTVSGRTVKLPLEELSEKLEAFADRLMEHIREQEWIDLGKDEKWFNSYYDNHKRPVEGITEDGVRMMLTGQVFAIMSGTANDDQVHSIVKAADKYLYCRELGGYRLNTDFHELKFDMGRMFGFAYGEKENGSVFSHMAVMYANALYRRGFIPEGYKALKSLADAALNFENSKIFPGIPEYFNSQGRGMYHYLTGAASWYIMTVITQVFGVRGEMGNMVINPKLMNEQFDDNMTASIELPFAGKMFLITFADLSEGASGKRSIGKAYLVHPEHTWMYYLNADDDKVIIDRGKIADLPDTGNRITIELM